MADVTELCCKANEEYEKGNYEKALGLYSEALEKENNRDDIYCQRAQVNLQMGKLADANQDCDRTLQLNENNIKAYTQKGTILFQLKEVEKALDVFKEGQKRFESDQILKDWIQRCESELGKLSTRNKLSGEETAQSTDSTPTPVLPNIKYNWYQTHSHVIVSVMVKNVKQENLTLDVNDRSLKVTVKETDDTVKTLDLILSHLVDPSQTTSKIFSIKVEIKLKKREGIQWSSLEGAPEEEAKEACPASAVPVHQEPPPYPSSSHHTKDWNKLAAEVTEEEKKEKLEGDAALNQFFQKIYADASDDTKKAMMKSFFESGGTVLSTNWEEVGSKRVEVKPPDGMEFKKWEV